MSEAWIEVKGGSKDYGLLQMLHSIVKVRGLRSDVASFVLKLSQFLETDAGISDKVASQVLRSLDFFGESGDWFENHDHGVQMIPLDGDACCDIFLRVL